MKTHPLLGQVARIDPAVVRFDAPSAEGEAKAQAGSIGASLLERAEQLVDVPPRETAAFVLDLDQHALGAGADPQRDGGTRAGELECVLQQISHHRREDLPVSLDRHSILDGHHGEPDAPGVCLQRCGRRELFDEFGHQELLPILDALREPDLGERTTDERA